jgi:TPR repeat protein
VRSQGRPKNVEAPKRGGAHNNDARRRRRRIYNRSRLPPPAAADMDPVARRRARVEFRVKLSRDTGANLTAAACEELLDTTFTCEALGEVSLESNPGGFYTCLGEVIEDQRLALVHADHLKVAWWCFREAAEVHKHPGGMGRLAYYCLYHGRGVTEDPVQAVVWYLKAAGLGDVASKARLGKFFVKGDARAGVAKDAARGLGLLREAVEQGCGEALYQVAVCYLYGEGVEKDAVHGVALLRKAVEQEDSMTALAQTCLSICYANGDGLEADTVQAALWCQRAAAGGNQQAILMLPIIRKCNFCGTTPARQLCARCEKVRYCDRRCQLAHWNRETDTHKGHCRRLVPRHAAEASDEDGASSSSES